MRQFPEPDDLDCRFAPAIWDDVRLLFCRRAGYLYSFFLAIKVGLPVTEQPPRRSLRAVFPHKAPR